MQTFHTRTPEHMRPPEGGLFLCPEDRDKIAETIARYYECLPISAAANASLAHLNDSANVERERDLLGLFVRRKSAPSQLHRHHTFTILASLFEPDQRKTAYKKLARLYRGTEERLMQRQDDRKQVVGFVVLMRLSGVKLPNPADYQADVPPELEAYITAQEMMKNVAGAAGDFASCIRRRAGEMASCVLERVPSGESLQVGEGTYVRSVHPYDQTAYLCRTAQTDRIVHFTDAGGIDPSAHYPQMGDYVALLKDCMAHDAAIRVR